MKREPLLYGIIGILIGGVIIWFLTVNAVNNNYTSMMQMMGMSQLNSSNSGGMTSNIDRHFIEQMIPHHEDAITMAKLALINAKRTEVVKLSQNIIDSQGKEINQMKVWYRDWFGEDVPQGAPVMGQHGMTQGSGMHMGMMGDESDLARLEQAENFDQVFLEEMIPHHQMAVMMANMLKGGTDRPQMKQLTDDIITAQTKEIEQMRTWLKDWGF